MTVSQRASQLYKKGGMTWSQAMSQAYEEIARPRIIDSKIYLDDLVRRARDAIGGIGILSKGNDVIADIIEELEDKYIDTEGLSEEQAYKMAEADLNSVGMDIESLIYEYSKKDEWDAMWRGSDGKVSNELRAKVDQLIQDLKISRGSITNYTAWSAYFS